MLRYYSLFVIGVKVFIGNFYSSINVCRESRRRKRERENL